VIQLVATMKVRSLNSRRALVYTDTPIEALVIYVPWQNEV